MLGELPPREVRTKKGGLLDSLKVIGKGFVRTDYLAKVTGQAVFTADIELPGMLVAKVLRSPHALSRILNIDGSRALRVPGVKAVVSGFDGYGIKWGVFRYSQDHSIAAFAPRVCF